MATTLSPSGLKTVGSGAADWMSDYFDNVERLNDHLLFLCDNTGVNRKLGDVVQTGLTNGSVLRYNSSSGKWTPWVPHINPLTTTTTTT